MVSDVIAADPYCLAASAATVAALVTEPYLARLSDISVYASPATDP
jgi:hypothetical protein